ncbi:prepilin-type N-terminal cleavage/methylation domain-containing protein [Bacillus sp. OxB-1]|uniref:type II secretion system protein n=1 Tax=Bacillus sp. (strain OxB-1) TaxID=98228 RepID=UPI00058233F5|nr:type II secretion system protein [Bacillus sp. OxB-1]BAQ11586.1 prepilin-type N-terminal cleavage/methylation domain-containing protein [Bacillus sp. OxB-1]
MKKFLQKRMKNEKGLTLVELLAVIVILGIIAAIAVPSIGNIIQNTREKAFIADAQNALSAANLYFTEKNPADNDEVELQDLIDEGFFNDVGSLETATVTYKADAENTISAGGTAGNTSVAITDKTNSDLSEQGREALD